MNSPRILLLGIILLICSSLASFGQTKAPSKYRSSSIIEKQELAIDSLTTEIDNLRVILFRTDSFYQNEKITSAKLRDEIIQLDDYRQRLEQNNDEFKGENLKLNQSNRILIIFNSLVAILLVVTLIFFLKRLSKKKDTSQINKKSVVETVTSSKQFASFEDRLIQLERLGKLREKGLLSEDEFITQKQNILGK